MEDIETVWLDLSNPLGAVIVTGSNYGQIHNITPVEPPRVQGGPRVSPPDPNGTWMEGKTVEVIVTFNEAVEVKTNGGTPTIGINLDTSRSREAPYARGTDTHEMVFAYTIANGDGNTNRIAVNPNSIKRNGAEVRQRRRPRSKPCSITTEPWSRPHQYCRPRRKDRAQGSRTYPRTTRAHSSSSTCTSTPRYRGSATKPCRAHCSMSKEAR